MGETTKQVTKIRDARTVAGSRLPALSGGGRKDSGKARSYRWLKPSDDQSGLVTLEWIILIAAVSGIVTLALLAGWNALWNRSDSLSDEGGSGHQLAANRAAAEASTGRACSLLNDLYSYDFKYVYVTSYSDCRCEIGSSANASQVCGVEKLTNYAVPIVVEPNNVSREIDVAPLFFSENSADLTYTITSIPDTNIASASFKSAPDDNILVVTSASGGGQGTTNVWVKAADSHTGTSASGSIQIGVENTCLPIRAQSTWPRYHIVNTNPSQVGAVRISALHLNDYLRGPIRSFNLASSPGSQNVFNYRTFAVGDQTALFIYPLHPGLGSLSVTSTDCWGGSETKKINVIVNSNELVKSSFTAQTYSTSPQTIDLSSHFDEGKFSGGGVTYGAISNSESVATVAVSSNTLTITKVASGMSEIWVYARSNGGELRQTLNVTFS